MNNKVILSAFAFMLLLLVSCHGPKALQDIIDIKYHYGSTGLSSRIRLDGIYIHKFGYVNSKDSDYFAVIFYDDGTFAELFIKSEEFESKDFDLLRIAKKRGNYSIRNNTWKAEYGNYIIEGDYINCNYYNPLFPYIPSLLHWQMTKYYWHIVDSNTIELCARLICLRSEVYSKDELYEFNEAKKDPEFYKCAFENYTFVPLTNLPSSYTKYRKKSWMWESKEEMDMYFKDREKNEH